MLGVIPWMSAIVAKDQQHFFVRNLWYYALPSAQLKPGQILAREFLGEPVVLGRTQSGQVFALRDICPHRAVPLSAGRFDGQEIECCYHGWRFNGEGQCTLIPALVEGQTLNLDRFQVRTYPLAEKQGNLWIYMAAAGDRAIPPEQRAIPEIPAVGDRAPNVVVRLDFPCYIDHAVVGLMDPTHLPFVHRSKWWKDDPTLVEEVKQFDPLPYGFCMRRHRVVKVPELYRLLGRDPETEISFSLPGIRIEELATDRHTVCNLTAVTPINENRTEVYTMLYWDLWFLDLLKPIIKQLSREFLGQDRDVVVKQQQGLKYDPTLLLINDADTQARWYIRLKHAYHRATQAKESFRNPIRAQVLRWRC